eukprot:1223940-Prorocentrum_lima.AAC.1
MANLQSHPTGTVLLVYDVKKAGEPLTRPDQRHTPLREKDYNRLVRAVLEGRSKASGGGEGVAKANKHQ